MHFGSYKRNKERAFRFAGMFGGKVSEEYMAVGLFRSSTHCVEGLVRSMRFRIYVSAIGVNLWLYDFCLPDGIEVSLNKSYPMMLIREPVTDLFPEYGMPVYKSKLREDLPWVKRFLKDRFTFSAIQALRLSQKDRLFIGQMQLWMWHHSTDDDFFTGRFNRLVDLILHHAIEPAAEVPRTITSRYADIRGVVINQKRIPEKLRTLLPLAKQWAIGDDIERQRYLHAVPDEERKALFNAVAGLKSEIEQWTQQHRNDIPVPDEVILFDMMNEAFAEVEAEFFVE